MTSTYTERGVRDSLPIVYATASWDWVAEQAFFCLWTPHMNDARARGDTHCTIECGDEFCENARALQEAALRFFARQQIPHYPMFVHEKTRKRRVVYVAV